VGLHTLTQAFNLISIVCIGSTVHVRCSSILALLALNDFDQRLPLACEAINAFHAAAAINSLVLAFASNVAMPVQPTEPVAGFDYSLIPMESFKSRSS
jgi:hypothetical protein